MHTMGSSPRKMFTNDDVYYDLDIPLEFAEVVEILNPDQDNTMKPRSKMAYYLCPVNNSAKDHFFMTDIAIHLDLITISPLLVIKK